MPKVVFSKMPLNDSIDLVKDCFYASDELISVYSGTIQLFPELKTLDSLVRSVENDKIIEDVVNKRYNKYQLFDDDIERYSNAWDKYNDTFFEALIKYLNCSWPEGHEIVPAYVGIIPISPRYLDSLSFAVPVGIKDEWIIETCAHELCHFLWFKKWKELFPDTKDEDLCEPSLIWEYSEMVVEPILNSKEISKVFDNKKAKYCYESFYINDAPFMNDLMDIYNSNITVEEKIIRGYEHLQDIRNKTKKVPM